MIRAVVAEDSTVTRDYLVALLAEDPAVEVVGTACDGVEAVAEVERHRPDVVVMDIHMPRMNGLEATRRIMETIPTPIVLVSASLQRHEIALTFEALQAGALTVIDKPRGLGHARQDAMANELVRTVKLMAEIKVVQRRPRREARAPSPLRGPHPGRHVRLVAIGASTGGPGALVELLQGLHGVLAVPVLVVQHIAPGFTEGFVEWLGIETRLPVKLAEDGEPAQRGTVYVAPDSREMGIGADGRIRLSAAERADAFRPSVAHLFESVAHTYRADVLPILLTGMGRDGAEELRRLRDLGAETVVQDEATSVVFGMPGEAVRLGAAEHVLPPEEIAEIIRSRTGGDPERT
jgi:two-component system chemotaxis response regulator CheB